MMLKGKELYNKPNWQTGQTHWSSHTNSEEKMFSTLYNHNKADRDWDDRRTAHCFCCKTRALVPESTESNASVFLIVLYLQTHFYL